VRVHRTLQISDTKFPHIFAVGDVADTGAHKAARPAIRQAPVVVENIQHLADNEPLENYEVAEGPSIHLSLGLVSCGFLQIGPDDVLLTAFCRRRISSLIDESKMFTNFFHGPRPKILRPYLRSNLFESR
jgi:hypothetical protein